jgi:GNAT superfamily N-acetyltransferase
MNIRKATLSDVEPIMQLVAGVVPVMRAAGNLQWDHTYPNPTVFTEDITLNQLWVADIDGQIAGVAAITTDQYPEYQQVGWDITKPAIVVHRLAVSVNYQGKGVAQALMAEAEAEAIRRNIHLLRIDTNSKNTGANKVFEKAGYVFAGEITLEFRPGSGFNCYQKVL